MWIELTEAAQTVWTWLPTITNVARAITAVTAAVIGVRRAVRDWRTSR
ncbi:hypothetical protein [Actinophytocola algeriensis]|uniref:Uncharacterized protein n=1 Tax=Actinophytocola algeriensis TaxID=1768010 RepID=A0A7W7VK29_9PSEU|nr:hypothetical protein [Actinophytocola algeriensis]MBB4912645.1 hypothetical protein [Actinophytocola algeriensis]MBE1472021.1 hypothetical protein [Actinophytocola algeriensis]